MSEDRFHKLIRDLHVGVIVHGPASEILVSNQAALDLLGLTEEQLHGLTSFDPSWEIIREDGTHFDAADRPVATVTFTRAPVTNVVMGIHRPRIGDRVWILVDAYPEFAPDGRVVQVTATLTDITERKRLEESLQQAQKLESIGRLAGGIAHDFNNLLTVMISCTELALRKIPADSSARRELEETIDAAMRAAALTKQLLTFARKQSRSPRTVHVPERLRAIQSLLVRLIGESVALTVEAPEDVWLIRTDPSQLEQVLVNLAVNARDAMPDGGTLRIDAANVQGTEAHDGVPPGDYVRIRVADTGQGMDEVTRRRVFEPFFTTKPVGQGTGLGLATAHAIIAQDGGHIAVESAPGEGTTFQIYLRRSTSPLDARSASTADAALTLDATILLAEDEPLVRAVASRVLRSLGCTVLEAHDGAHGLEVSRSYPGNIDLLVTDVSMPVLDGRRLATAVRLERPSTQVLFVSGYSEEPPSPEEGRFLPKPYTPSALAREVRALVLHETPPDDEAG